MLTTYKHTKALEASSSDLEAIRRSGIAFNLGKEAVDSILSETEILTCDAGEVVKAQGELCCNVYVILSGYCEAMRIERDGHEVGLELLTDGDVHFDGDGLVNSLSYTTLRASTPTRIWSISVNFLRKKIGEDASFALNVLHVIARKNHHAINTIHRLQTRSPLQRLGHYLLQQHLHHGKTKPNEKGTLRFELYHPKKTLAAHLGMKPETLSRSLKALRTMGIEVEGSEVSLENDQKLCRFCDNVTMKNCAKANTGECHYSNATNAYT